jgi:hypothetical protein
MRVFPKERYGQFCSANAMIRSILVLVGGLAAGVFMDVMKRACHGSDYAYRFMSTWTFGFSLLSYICLLLVYREWKRLGGDKTFVPPEPGCASGEKV